MRTARLLGFPLLLDFDWCDLTNIRYVDPFTSAEAACQPARGRRLFLQYSGLGADREHRREPRGITKGDTMPQPVQEGSYARTAALFAGLIALVVIAYFFGDRQLAGALRPYTNGVPFFIWLTYIVKPLTVAASIAAVSVAIVAIRDRELSPVSLAFLRLACAVLVSGVLTLELKEVFGRTWPETWINNNPSYFGNGTYGFFPFHGGQGWA